MFPIFQSMLKFCKLTSSLKSGSRVNHMATAHLCPLVTAFTPCGFSPPEENPTILPHLGFTDAWVGWRERDGGEQRSTLNFLWSAQHMDRYLSMLGVLGRNPIWVFFQIFFYLPSTHCKYNACGYRGVESYESSPKSYFSVISLTYFYINEPHVTSSFQGWGIKPMSSALLSRNIMIE